MKERVIRWGCVLLLLQAFLMVTSFSTAHAWWNNDWQGRRKITLNTTASGADIKASVDEVPVLVRLHSGNFDFTQAKDDGSDIRFVDSDDLTLLKHHIEWYDAIDEVAAIWVCVPRITASSTTGSIWMYYANADAAAGSNPQGTYDKNYTAVFHLSDIEGLPTDMTGYGNSALEFSGGQALPSIIGKGISLNGAGDRMVIQSTPSLDISGGFTFAAWVRFSSPQEDSYLFSRQNGNKAIVVGISGIRLYCRVISPEANNLMTGTGSEISPDAWHHVAVTAEHKGRLAMYIDGAQVYTIDLSPVLPDLSGDIVFGASPDGKHAYFGDLDEVSLSNTARSEAWVKIMYASQVPGTMLCSFSEPELFMGSGSMILGYMSIVGRNITLSGWIIIGILMIILAISTVIFVDKAYILHSAIRDTDGFLNALRTEKDFAAVDYGEDIFEDSPLFRIYRQGCAAVKNHLRLCQDGTSYMHPKAIDFLRSEMERLSVREVQNLNSRLVMLTVAVSGGPFLGLLGTVWGVMNTFAAMAQAGEANIMAIAPGVASALATTVFGLIVAIPAMFGYNYLTTRIRNMTADIYVFIDGFAVNVEENYGEYEAEDDRSEAGRGAR